MNFTRQRTILLTSLFLIIGCSDGNPNMPTGSSSGSGGAAGGAGGSGGEGGSGGSGGSSGIQIEKPGNAIEGQYIFMLDKATVTPDMVSDVAQALLAPQNGALLNVYDSALIGFAANNLDDDKALAIAKDPRVKGIVQDNVMQVNTLQEGATWGIDRIDTRIPMVDGKYEYYGTGQGVNVYIVDTGIRGTHQDFGGRVMPGHSAWNGYVATDDCVGHGTHVAGTVGGTKYGVAKSVTLHPVRVFPCSNSTETSVVIAGVNWVAKNHKKPAVINLSLGGLRSEFFNNLINDIVGRLNITCVVAAGNEDQDTKHCSPASAAEALTVGATHIGDSRASFSNWGSVVDLFAPGEDILSAWKDSDTAEKAFSGTSMAAPHVTGVVALYLEKNPTATPAQVSAALLNSASRDVVKDAKGSPNKLLYSFYAPSTAFKGAKPWSNELSDTSDDNEWYANERRYGSIQYADVNGDKRDDVCAYVSDGIRCALSDGTGAFGPFVYWSNDFGPQWDPAPYWSTIRLADVNGDGKADICGRGTNGIFCGLSMGSGFGGLTVWSSAFKNSGVWETDAKYYGTLQFPDINGDKKADICGRGPNGVVCAVSTGTAFGTSSVWAGAFSDAQGWGETDQVKTLRFPDVNGDGKADVCGRGPSGMMCAISTGTKFNTPTNWSVDYGNDGVWESDPKYYETIQFPDLDGDKKADVCGRRPIGLRCALSKGTVFGASSVWVNLSDSVWGANPAYWATIRYQDVNGDGKMDVCGRGVTGVGCALSSGTAFGTWDLWGPEFSNAKGWPNSAAYWSTIRFPDLNGDGSADICGRGIDGLFCGLGRP